MGGKQPKGMCSPATTFTAYKSIHGITPNHWLKRYFYKRYPILINKNMTS